MSADYSAGDVGPLGPIVEVSVIRLEAWADSLRLAIQELRQDAPESVRLELETVLADMRGRLQA